MCMYVSAAAPLRFGRFWNLAKVSLRHYTHCSATIDHLWQLVLNTAKIDWFVEFGVWLNFMLNMFWVSGFHQQGYLNGFNQNFYSKHSWEILNGFNCFSDLPLFPYEIICGLKPVFESIRWTNLIWQVAEALV